MLRLPSITALCLRNTLATRTATLNTTNRAYSKDDDSSDDEKETKSKQMNQENKKPNAPAEEKDSAATRLNRLLASMQTDDNLSLMKKATSMARPGEANRKRKEGIKHEAASKDIFEAAKNVAAILGGNDQESKKQTESELLAKLLGHKTGDSTASTAELNNTNTKPVEELSLSELIVGMKINRRQQSQDQTRAEYVRRTLNGRQQQKQHETNYNDSGNTNRRMRKQSKREAISYTGSVNLFGNEPLGIFKDVTQLNESKDMLKTWSHLQERELQLHVTHPPANYFEKMALWTEQGKVWRFPINNEQDWTEEVDVDFSEHIFLEQHLESWCPSKGPVRHFMELVCVGLSKNPYITAKDKKEHILWYRDYFTAKKDILRHLMDKEEMDNNKSQLEA